MAISDYLTQISVRNPESINQLVFADPCWACIDHTDDLISAKHSDKLARGSIDTGVIYIINSLMIYGCVYIQMIDLKMIVYK